jgi:hypothetical protein
VTPDDTSSDDSALVLPDRDYVPPVSVTAVPQPEVRYVSDGDIGTASESHG